MLLYGEVKGPSTQERIRADQGYRNCVRQAAGAVEGATATAAEPRIILRRTLVCPIRSGPPLRSGPGFGGDGTPQSPSSFFASENFSIANSRSSRVWAAEPCVRILALPFGTTGNEKPMT